MQEQPSAKILHPSTQNWVRKQEVRGQAVKEPIASINDAELHSVHASFLFSFAFPHLPRIKGFYKNFPLL